MYLFTALFPPRSALEELTDVVRSVPVTNELDVTPADEMYIRITQFGNVAAADARALAALLGREAAGWRAPTLWFAGGTALEWRGDQSVWAKLGGDVDDLVRIGRGVPAAVQRLGFFVDRRQFKPWLSVGTITDYTTAGYLESLVAALEHFRGRSWLLPEVGLVQRRPLRDGRDGGFEVLERFPLAGAAPVAAGPSLPRSS